MALNCEETFITSMFHKGLMFRRIEEYTAALVLFSNVISLLENDETVFIQRGLIYQDMGNHNKAIEDFRKAIEIAESKQVNNYYQYYYLGISLLKSRQPKEALKELEKADGLAGSGYPGI